MCGCFAESGLVRQTLVGRQRRYELDATQFAGLIDWLDQFTLAAGWQRRLDALETEVHRKPSRAPPGRHGWSPAIASCAARFDGVVLERGAADLDYGTWRRVSTVRCACGWSP